MEMAELTTQAVASVPIVALINVMKSKGFFGNDPKIRGCLAFVTSSTLAFLNAIGAHYNVEGTLSAGFTITLTAPPLDVMLNAAYHYVSALSVQHGMFKTYQALNGLRSLPAILSLAASLSPQQIAQAAVQEQEEVEQVSNGVVKSRKPTKTFFVDQK